MIVGNNIFMKNKTYIFTFHSFVDLITNSSTVIFTQATDKTIKSFHELVNEYLKLANSTKTSEDIFRVRLVREKTWREQENEEEAMENGGEELERYSRKIEVVGGKLISDSKTALTENLDREVDIELHIEEIDENFDYTGVNSFLSKVTSYTNSFENEAEAEY